MCCALDTSSKDLIGPGRWQASERRIIPKHCNCTYARIRRCNPTVTGNRGAAIRRLTGACVTRRDMAVQSHPSPQRCDATSSIQSCFEAAHNLTDQSKKKHGITC